MRTPETAVIEVVESRQIDRFVQEALRPGAQLGQYRIDAPMARTLLSRVSRAMNTETGELVAIKVPRRATGATLLRREIAVHRLVRPSDSQGIVSMTGNGTIGESDLPFMATQLLPGGTLWDVVRSKPRGPELRSTVRIICDAACGLLTLHRHRYVHGDVKPANIGVGADGQGRLLDFGTAELAGKEMHGTIYGTHGESVPPEAYEGGGAGFARDVWSLGHTAFKTFTGGRSPFDLPESNPGGLPQILSLHKAFAAGPKRTLCELVPAVPPEIDEVVTAMLDPAPQNRPQLGEVVEILTENSK